jgi:hypothetical protein
MAVRLKRRLVRQPNGCLEWQGCTGDDGYGQIGDGAGKVVRTHRAAWELANGPIPDGLHVLHHCDNPPCGETEPSEAYPEGHLFLGTNDDNVADKMAKGRHRSRRTLDEWSVNQVRAWSSYGFKQYVIASWFGVSPSCVSRVVTERRWASC